MDDESGKDIIQSDKQAQAQIHRPQMTAAQNSLHRKRQKRLVTFLF